MGRPADTCLVLILPPQYDHDHDPDPFLPPHRLQCTNAIPILFHIPLHTNTHSPQFFFRTADVTGNCLLPKDVEMVVPGDNASIEVELINEVAMAEGLRFAIREGGKTVGAGVVSKVLE